MLGDITFWGAIILVVAILAVPVWGNWIAWKKTGFAIPPFVHVCALLLFAGFVFSSLPIGSAALLAVYAMYGAFGRHWARQMARCEQEAGRGIENEKARVVLCKELCPFKDMSRADLAAKLWKPVEKEVAALDDVTYKVRIEVVPAMYAWEGGNTPHFSALTKAVDAGGDIKVIGVLTPARRSIWRREVLYVYHSKWIATAQSMPTLPIQQMRPRSNPSTPSGRTRVRVRR